MRRRHILIVALVVIGTLHAAPFMAQRVATGYPSPEDVLDRLRLASPLVSIEDLAPQPNSTCFSSAVRWQRSETQIRLLVDPDRPYWLAYGGCRLLEMHTEKSACLLSTLDAYRRMREQGLTGVDETAEGWLRSLRQGKLDQDLIDLEERCTMDE